MYNAETLSEIAYRSKVQARAALSIVIQTEGGTSEFEALASRLAALDVIASAHKSAAWAAAYWLTA